MPEETITFKDWKTGEEVKYSPSYGGASASARILKGLSCPFDKTPLVSRRFVYGETEVFCPNCLSGYPSRTPQQGIDKYARKEVKKKQEELRSLRTKTGELEEFLEFAENAIE